MKDLLAIILPGSILACLFINATTGFDQFLIAVAFFTGILPSLITMYLHIGDNLK